MTKPKKPEPRPKRSGFARQLRAYLARNREAWEERREYTGPRNAQQLAEKLSADGEEVSGKAVRYWKTGDTLPESRFVAMLERMMGAPWTYLDDPSAPVVDEDVRRVWAAALALAASQRARAVAALQKAPGRTGS